jgi:predicted dehydrogenase
LQAGKPVYLEKPMAMDAASAKRIAAVAKETGIKLCIAHYRRQQPLFLKIKSLLQEGAIGDMRLVHLELFQSFKSPLIMPSEEPWRFNPAISGGGLFHDLAPHQLDLMINFFGKVKQVSGMSLNTAGLYVPDDTVSGQILFENDVLFNGMWSFVVPEEETKDQCVIIGSEGKISFSVFGSTELKLTKNGIEEILQFDKLEHVQQPMIEKVVQYFLGEGPNPSPAEDGVEVMRLIDTFTKK